MLKAAVLFASRSTELVTVTGEKIRGVGINPMQIVDGSTLNLDKFVFKAKELLVYSGLSQDVSEDITVVLDQMYSCFNLFKKFDSVMNEISIRPAGVKESDAFDFSSGVKIAGWLCFILSKRNIPEFKETFELIFLMAAVVSFMLNSFNESTVLTIRTTGDKKQSKEAVIEFMLTYLKIKDVNLLLRVQESVRTYLKKRLQTEVGPFDLHTLDRLTILQKKLDHLYQKQINFEELDERLFLANRKKNLSPKLQSPVKR